MAGRTTSKSTTTKSTSIEPAAKNAVVKVTDADGRVHFTSRQSALATAPDADISEVDEDDAELSTPGDADAPGTAGS